MIAKIGIPSAKYQKDWKSRPRREKGIIFICEFLYSLDFQSFWYIPNTVFFYNSANIFKTEVTVTSYHNSSNVNSQREERRDVSRDVWPSTVEMTYFLQGLTVKQEGLVLFIRNEWWHSHELRCVHAHPDCGGMADYCFKHALYTHLGIAQECDAGINEIMYIGRWFRPEPLDNLAVLDHESIR